MAASRLRAAALQSDNIHHGVRAIRPQHLAGGLARSQVVPHAPSSVLLV